MPMQFGRGVRKFCQPKTAILLFAALALSGCKTFSPDGGLGLVEELAGGPLNKQITAIRNEEDAEIASEKVAKLLRRPLTADAAVQIALLNNRDLQAAYNELGMAEAAMVGAHLLPNPVFSVERISSSVELEIERRVIANLLAIVTLPARARIAQDRFRQAQLRAAEETLRVAAETRRTFYRALAAAEVARFLDESKTAAETATQLAKRLGETGAINKADQAREMVFYAEVAGQHARMHQQAESARERLVRLMGLWGGNLNFRLASSLPPLPNSVRGLPDVERQAVLQRVDLHAARTEVEMLAKTYGLTNATRFINLLEVAGVDQRIKEKATGERIRPRGFEIEFQVPIFDFGEVRHREAQLAYMQAVNRLTHKAVNVRSEARDAYRTMQSNFQIARHYQSEVLPLRRIISEETLLRYNAMQIDVFALLAEARQRINANVTSIEAHRDFWLSATDVMTAVFGGGTGGAEPGRGATAMAEQAGGGH
jgi:outer membrane protein TolC